MTKPLLLTALLTLACLAGAQDAKTTIAADYKAMDKLFGNRDSSGLEKFMRDHTTPGFYSTAGGQKFNLEQNFAQITPLLKQATTVNRPPTKIYSIIVSGNHATAKLYGGFTATVNGRDGKVHQMSGSGKATDHWVKNNGEWRIEMTEAYDQAFSIDGKSPPMRRKK